MTLKSLAMLMIGAGVLLIVVGGLLWLAGHLNWPIGRLPGDLHVEGRRWSVHFPIVTCLILSLLLTVILNLFFRR